MQRTSFSFLLVLELALHATRGLAQQPPHTIDIRADVLEDKIRGGMLAQIIGNLNGLRHEFKYIDEPGTDLYYIPSLPNGAFTDDDTDIEWVYIREIALSGENFLPPDRIAQLWKRHINRRIFCANRYARDLMDLGFEPPWTGNFGLNPWSEFNISGQFICESFGLMAPAMPQTAARLGLNYTRVAIDGEPAQATQLFTSMIATAFVEDDIDKIIDAGLAAIDPKSQIATVVTTTRKFCRNNPNHWPPARLQIKNRWQTHGGIVRDRNGYELNTACTIAALIYGNKEFDETLRIAFNLGWDADNNAATAATIVGVIKGRRRMNEQHWNIKDVYRNTTRDDMPNDETITGLENTLIEAARVTIKKNGGKLTNRDSNSALVADENAIYHIPTERPTNIEPLATLDDQRARLRAKFAPQIKRDLAASGVARARAAYLAVCLDETEKWKRESPLEWSAAIAELEKYPAVIRDLFHSPKPADDPLRASAERAGLRDPKNVKLTERPVEDR